MRVNKKAHTSPRTADALRNPFDRWQASAGALLVIATLGAILISGCEDGQDSVQREFGGNPINTSGQSTVDNTESSDPFNARPLSGIIPASVTMPTTGGNTVHFTPDGGMPPFHWDVSIPELGTIDSHGVYTSKPGVGGNTVILTDNDGTIITAEVTQEGAAATLVLSPTSVALAADGDTQTFTASGGTPPYTWSMSDYARGGFSVTTSTSALYLRKTSGNNSVICTDSKGQSTFASVAQP